MIKTLRSLVTAKTYPFWSLVVMSLGVVSVACSQTKSASPSAVAIPAALANPIAADQGATSLDAASPPPLSLDYGTAPYKAPAFCGEPADDTMKLYMLQANGSFALDEAGTPVGFTQKDVKNFICNILPVAIRMDRIVFRQRRYVEYLNQQEFLSTAQGDWLTQLKQEYGLTATANVSDLLQRVDIGPIPLLLAQGALESAWGQSRFATQGFNFFGIHGDLAKDGASKCMMTTSTPAVCVRKYPNISAGVSDYLEFINTEASQDPLRVARAQARATNGDVSVPLDSITMAQTMGTYSQIGQAYTTLLINLIKSYDLSEFAFDESLMPPLK